MKSILRSVSIMLLMCAGIQAIAQPYNQNANPRIGGISTTPNPVTGIGTLAVTTVTFANAGLDPIPAGTVEVNLSLNNYLEYVSALSIPKFAVTFTDPSDLTFVVLTNTAQINAFETVTLTFQTRTTAYTPNTAIGGYGASTNIVAGQNSNVGNLLPADDNATAVIIVSPSVVPVQLSSFDVASSKCITEVTWKTATEIGITEYEVQVSSDARHFAKAASKPAVGNGNNSYSIALNSSDATAYYRLAIISNNEPVKYSDIKRVENSCKEKWVVSAYPNPVSIGEQNFITLKAKLGTFNGTYSAVLVDNGGKVFKTADITLNNAATYKYVFPQALSRGKYTLRLARKDGTQSAVIAFDVL